MEVFKMNAQASLPTASPRLFLDKVGFQFPSSFLEGETYRSFAKGEVTLLKWGLTARILVHDERLRRYDIPAVAVFDAVVEMADAGVFQAHVSGPIFLLNLAYRTGEINFLVAFLLLANFFEFDEMELTLDLPAVEFFGTFNMDVFTQVGGFTFYSQKDFKKKRRGQTSERALRCKGIQKSFLTVYRKDLQLGLPEPLTRVELRFSGRYRKYLQLIYLFLPADATFLALAPVISRILGFLGVVKGVQLNPINLLVPGSPLAGFIDQLELQN